MTRFLHVLFFFVFTSNAYAQQLEFAGTVIDSINGQPIPFAHIHVVGSGIGTVSNQTGQFRLFVPKEASSEIQVSCIGYQTRKLFLSKQKLQISLSPDVQTLLVVIITPKDHARLLLQRAIDHIPVNYPNQPTLMEGFVREHTYWEGNADNPVYIAESSIELSKKSYTKEENTGAVRLLKYRKHLSDQMDTLLTRIYGGVHSPHRFDIVASREGCLDKPGKFELLLCDTLTQDGQLVFKLCFNDKKGTSGHLMIQDSTYSILVGSFYQDKSAFHWMDLSERRRIFRNFEASYVRGPDNDTWHLGAVTYETAFTYQNDTLQLRNHYATTRTGLEYEPIPYPEQFKFNDVLLEANVEHDTLFWEGNNTILADQEIASLFIGPERVGSSGLAISRKQRLLDILRKLSVSYGATLQGIVLMPGDIAYKEEVSLIRNVRGTGSFLPVFQNEMAYRVTNRLKVKWMAQSSLKANLLKANWIAFQYDLNLNPKGSPFFLSPSLGLGYQQLRNNLSTLERKNNLKIGKKDFDADRVDVYLEERSISILPTVRLSITNNKRLRFYVEGSYNLSLFTVNGLYFIEDEFFMKRKKAFVPEKAPSLDIQRDNGRLLKNTWQIGMGVSFLF